MDTLSNLWTSQGNAPFLASSTLGDIYVAAKLNSNLFQAFAITTHAMGYTVASETILIKDNSAIWSVI